MTLPYPSVDTCVTRGGLVDPVPVELEQRGDGLPEDDHDGRDEKPGEKLANCAKKVERVATTSVNLR